ncbi:Glucose-responsive transcription factor [Ascosphaera atra]|nr:Glucose-responsive transcription factor [Ascosphaera atra]
MRTGHPSSRSRSSNLVLLMSLLLMALEADARGPENLRGQNGLPKAALLEGAHTIAWWLAKELNVNRTYIPAGLTNEQAASGSAVEGSNAVGGIEDPDSDHALARRVWVVTAIMSRWHALATAGPDVFEAVEVATLEDKKCLTAGVLQLARYSTLISEIYDLVFDASANGVASSRALKRMISGQIARIGDIEAGLSTAAGLESSASEMDRYVADTLSPQMYWFLTMLLRRHLHSDNPAEILYPAEVMVDLLHKHFVASNTLAEETDSLQQPQISIKQSPFDVHFLSLTALTLLELTENPTLQSDAWKALHKLRPILDTRERLATEASKLEFSAASFFRTVGWDASLRSLIDIRAAADHNSTANVNVDNVGENGINLSLDFENGGDHENEMSLQRLADLAVGAGAKAEEKQGERNTGGATEEQMGQAQGGGQQSEGRVILVDHSRLTRKGYLNVVAGL